MPHQNQAGPLSSFSQSDFTDYQRRCLGASGYQHSHRNEMKPGYFNDRSPMRQGHIKSDQESYHSLELTQTRSETEARLAKLQYEVAGLVNRYQVAEGELQSVGHSIGNSSGGKDISQNNYWEPDIDPEASRTSFGDGTGTQVSQHTNSGNHQVLNALNATPPRAPLQQRLNYLHDITPPRLSYSQHQRAPTQLSTLPSCMPPQPIHYRSNSLHVPVPVRYTHSSPHLLQPGSDCASESDINQPPPSHAYKMHNSDHHFPPIPSATHSHYSVNNNVSNVSSDSNSLMSPYGSPRNHKSGTNSVNLKHFTQVQRQSSWQSMQGQSPMNYYNSLPIGYRQQYQQKQQNQPPQHSTYIPRTPSGRQF